MTRIFGPTITKPVVVPEHVVHILDTDAYWSLDWHGNQDDEGGFLYAKVAYPHIGDAQRQHEREKALRDHEREESYRRSRKRGPNRRTKNKAVTP